MRLRHSILILAALSWLPALTVTASANDGTFWDTNQVDPDQIITTVSLVYNEGTGLDASVMLTADQPLYNPVIRLAAPSHLEMDGKALIEHVKWTGSIEYLAPQKGITGLGPHRVDFTDPRGHVFTNFVRIPSARPLGIPKAISKGTGLTISWSGENFAPGEKLEAEIFLDDPYNFGEPDSVWVRVSADESGKLELAPQSLAKIRTGKAHINLIRTRRVELQNANAAGGVADTVYSSAPIAVTVVP